MATVINNDPSEEGKNTVDGASGEGIHREIVPARSRRHGSRAADLLLAVMLLLAPVLLLRPSIHGNDGVQNYVYVRSLLIDGDFDFTNEFAHYYQLEPRWFDNKELGLRRDAATGLPMNTYPVGCAILWAPWVAAAHWTVKVTSGAASADGYSRPYEWAVGWASCFYASAGLALLYGLVRRRFGAERAFWGVLLVWMASPLVFYMYFHASMSHACSFFWAALLLWIYARGDGAGRWAALGVIYGMLVLTRLQDAALIGAVAVGEVVRIARGANSAADSPNHFARRVWARVPRYLLFVAAAIIAFSPQFLVWKVLHGSYFSGPRAYLLTDKVNLLAPVHLHQVLFSSFHGLFQWHPALLLAFAGLFLAPHRCGWLKLVGLGAFAAQTWLIGSHNIWWAGASFGQRFYISTLPFLAIGSAALFRRQRGWSALALRGSVVALVLWNFGLMLQYALKMIPREAPVSIVWIAENNCYFLPKAVLGANLP